MRVETLDPIRRNGLERFDRGRALRRAALHRGLDAMLGEQRRDQAGRERVTGSCRVTCRAVLPATW